MMGRLKTEGMKDEWKSENLGCGKGGRGKMGEENLLKIITHLGDKHNDMK